MKKIFLPSVLIYAISSGIALSETLWVSGIVPPSSEDWQIGIDNYEYGNANKDSIPTQSSGQTWYDANKIWPIEKENPDHNHCGHATAANMIEWWQKQNSTVLNQLNVNYTSGVVDDSGASGTHYSPTIYKEIIAPTFSENAHPTEVIKWYFSGNPISDATGEYIDGHFYENLESKIQEKVGASFTLASLAKTYNCSPHDYTGTSNYLKTAIEDGNAIGLQIGGHAVTCWGAEFDENELLTSLYITDSDDPLNCGLRKVNIIDASDKSVNLMMGDQGLFVLDYTAEFMAGDISLGAYNMDLANIYTLNPGTEILSSLVQIPEPSTASLLGGLIAFSLIQRRRRH